MSTPVPRYRAYLLRLWDANSRGPPTWHASLEDTHTGERWGFAGLEELTAFLAVQLGGRPDPEGTLSPAEEDGRS
jgi:hypothetical protein